MQSDRHQRISERAYLIWAAEGRVHGRHDEHWHRAEREIAEEEQRIAAALADRAAGTARRRPRATLASAKPTGRTSDPTTRRGRRAPTGTPSR